MKKLSISLLLISLSCFNFSHTSDEKLTKSQERQIFDCIQEINTRKMNELPIPTFSETEPQLSPTYRKKINSQKNRELAALKTRIANDRTKQTNRELFGNSILLRVQQYSTPSLMPRESATTCQISASPSSSSANPSTPHKKISPLKKTSPKLAWR
jgi:hypothetical protein